MQRPNPALLLGFFLAVLAMMSGLTLLKGGVFIAQHEADTLHVMQIVLRMEAGQWPHLDFMTPLGVLAFAPIAFFVGQGAGIGHAIIYAQFAVAVTLMPAIWWVGISRLRGWLPYLFGAVVIVLVTALVFGTEEPTLAISMHYNRWAWAISFIAIIAAVLPPLGPRRPIVDGGIIGLCMAALALMKATYFVAFAPAILVALLARKSFQTLGVAIAAGGAVVAVVTMVAGVDFWFAYVNDLLLVARSDVRPQPGLSITRLIFGPAYIGATVAAVLGAVLLLQAGKTVSSLALSVLIPGFIYVTYQNFGNDPQWLPLLAILLLTLRPDGGMVNRWGWDIRMTLSLTALAALALATTSYYNLATSPYRQLGINVAWYEPILPHDTVHSDFQSMQRRNRRVSARISLNRVDPGLEKLIQDSIREDATMLLGEPLADCSLKLGLPGWIDVIAQDIEQAGLAKGKRLYVADIFSSYWMFGELEPLTHGAPWYYGGLPGFENADYVLVPLCPAVADVRKQVLDAIAKRKEITLTEIRRTPLYILLDIKRQ